eukprot:m.110117 g.110117  ORF g.110117 m.110117 type:complete len:54 (+) comp16971_c0_seq2:156-317(+)
MLLFTIVDSAVSATDHTTWGISMNDVAVQQPHKSPRKLTLRPLLQSHAQEDAG